MWLNPTINQTELLLNTSMIADLPVNRWFATIRTIEQEMGKTISFNFIEPEVDRGPPVGRYPTYPEMHEHIKAKASNNWNAYETATVAAATLVDSS